MPGPEPSAVAEHQRARARRRGFVRAGPGRRRRARAGGRRARPRDRRVLHHRARPGAAPLLEELRSCGVALAVDDFSSFYSTLGAIEVLPIDAIKLGSRYVRGVGELVGPDGEGDPLVAAVIQQAHARGLYVVAEGVETWGEAARLTELGCDRAHGWLFASAQRADKARWLLEHGRGWQREGGLPVPRLEA
jgi:hypothetical protein